MSERNARELLELCAVRRDSEIWREFVDRFGQRIASRVRRSLARFDAAVSRDEHQDLQQEVYCRLLSGDGKSLRRCRGTAEVAVSAYLGRVAESVVIDHLRSLSAAKRRQSRLIDAGGNGARELSDWVSDPRQTPEQRLLLREKHLRFLAGCRRLVGTRNPGRDLQVLYLAYFEGRTSREISEHLGAGLKPSTVDSLIHRIKKRMRQEGLEVPGRRRGGPRIEELG